MTMWYTSKISDQQSENTRIAQIQVSADSPWFNGHFPEAPVLPGIAQLGMVHDLVCRWIGRKEPISQISRVRFKQIIKPDQLLTLTVTASDDKRGHSFRIDGNDGLICSGQFRLGR